MYFPQISQSIQKEDVIILDLYEGSRGDIDYADYAIERYTNIPDYNADITLKFNKESYHIDDSVGFNIQIADIGINNLTESKPYFYILLYNPRNKLIGVFPDAPNLGTTSETYWKERQSRLSWEKSYNCPHDTLLIKNLCFPRDNFIKGYTEKNNKKIYFQFNYKVRESGNWKIYVLLFGENFKVRPNIPLTENEIKDIKNSITIKREEFSVKDQEIRTGYFGDIIKFIVAAIGYFSVGEKIYPFIEKKYKKYKTDIKNFIIHLMFLIIIGTLYFFLLIKVFD